MNRLQARDQEGERDETEAPKKTTWLYTFLGVVLSALISLLTTVGLTRQLRELLTLEALIAIGVLVALVVLVFVLSVRQRYNEREYLRDWQERQGRQRARKLERQIELAKRTAHESRNQRTDTEQGDEQAMLPEESLLRSIGLEPSP